MYVEYIYACPCPSAKVTTELDVEQLEGLHDILLLTVDYLIKKGSESIEGGPGGSNLYLRPGPANTNI